MYQGVIESLENILFAAVSEYLIIPQERTLVSQLAAAIQAEPLEVAESAQRLVI